MSLPFVAFQRPEFLLLLALVPVLVAFDVAHFRARARALRAFGGPGSSYVSISVARQRVKAGLVVLAVTAVIVACAGPTSGVRERQVRQQGVDVVVALDISQSMAAHDVAPDRLRAASDAIKTLGRQLVGSRVALVLFAGQGVVRYPPTTDPEVIAQALQNSGRSFRLQPGTALKTGIDAALSAFPPDVRDGTQRKVIVLFSDGEDTTRAEQPDLTPLRARNVRVYAIGVGTAAGGVIPTFDDNGKFTGNLLGAAGVPVVSRLDESALRSLADRTGGRYWQYTGGEAPIREVASEMRTLDRTEIAAEAGAVPDDRFQWVLAVAVVALLLEWLLADRRRMPTPRAIAVPRRSDGRASAA